MARLAIIGLGRWGRVLVDAAHGKSDRLRFTHGATRTRANAEDYCAERGIALLGGFDEALAHPEIDGVVLATPHSQHADQVCAAAAAGKHVFCEKPFTLTKADAERAVAAAEAAGLVLAAGHNRRFLPAMQRLKAMIADGALGRLLHVEGNMSGHVGARYKAGMWRIDPSESPAGGMAGSGIHVIDAMIHLLGPISEVVAQSDRLAHEIEFDDTTTMLFRFASGANGYLAALTATAPTFRLQVFGERAAAELRGETVLEISPVEGERVTYSYAPVSTERAQLEAFADAIAGRAPYPISTRDVIDGVAAFEAVAQSAASHARIRL